MQIEPHADIREAAATTFQMYTAFLQSGFSVEQSFELVRTTVEASMHNGNGGAK